MSFAALLVIATIGSMGAADAAIIDVLRYNLGEPGSFSGQLPQDSVGVRHETNAIIGNMSFVPGGVTDTLAPGSTRATNFITNIPNVSPGTGFYGASSAGLPTDNFAVELWARSPNVNQPVNDFLSLNGAANGSIRFRHGGGVWSASLFNVAWVGAVDGAGQTAVEDEWTNLAIIRSNGVSTFYIDGVAQAGTTNAAPTFGTDANGIHMGVSPGGATYFDGDLDSIRIFTFNPNVDNPVAALSINFVPEPSSLAIWGMLGMACCAIAWRMRRK